MAIAPNGLRTPRPPCDQPSTPLAWLEHNPSAPSSPLSPPDHHRGWVVTLDVAVRNSSDKPIVAFEFAAVYSDKMGDETTSATYISQNEHAIQPGDISKASAMDRNEWSQNGAGQVTLYISRVRFNDKTMWQDDRTHSCSRESSAK